MEGVTPKVVHAKDVPESALWVHDENDVNAAKLLADLFAPDFPIPLGVLASSRGADLRGDPDPAGAEGASPSAAPATSPSSCMSGDTWKIGRRGAPPPVRRSREPAARSPASPSGGAARVAVISLSLRRPMRPARPRSVLRELERIVGAARARRLPRGRLIYECDMHTFYKGAPDAVVLPETADAGGRRSCSLCRREQVPIVPRGSGTGLIGGAMAPARRRDGRR